MSEEWPGTPVAAAAPAAAEQWPGTPVGNKGPSAGGNNPNGNTGRFGSITSQAVKGIPILGALAEKGAAAANAVADPAVDAVRGAMGKQPLSPGNYSERYARHLAEMRGADKQFEENHPVLAPAVQFGGGMAAMAPGAGPIAGTASRVAHEALGLGGKTLGGQVARSAGSGAALGAGDAYIKQEGWTPDPDVAGGGALGGAVGAAGPVAGRMVGNVVNRFRGTTRAAIPPTSAEHGAAAQGNYDAARNSGLVVDPAGLHDTANVVETDMLHGTSGSGSYHPQQAPQTFAAMRALREQPQTPPGGVYGTAPVGPNPTSANGVMAIRDRLKATIENGGTVAGNKVDAKAAGYALQQIDHYLENIPGHHVLRGDPVQFGRQLSEGNANYGAGKRSERFAQEVLENAPRRANVTDAGENLGNITRQRLDKVILSNQKGADLGRGFNEPEIAAMKDEANGSRYTNALRRASSVTGGLKRGSAASAVGAGLAMHFGLPWEAGVAAPHAISYGLRNAAESRTVNGARRIDEMIRRRAPASAAANAAEAQRVGTLGETQRAGALASRAAEPTIANLLQTYFGGGSEK